MKYIPKNIIIFLLLFLLLFLCSCYGPNYYYNDKNDADDINIPIANISMNYVVDLDNIEKYDSKSLIPIPLKNGAEHNIVTSIQSRLMELGYMDEDKPTSYYQESTETAIKKFERQLGLKEDGICSAEIYDLLMNKNAITYEVKRGYFGDDIKILQQQLYELSYLLYSDDVTGYFGEKTEVAVTEMQKSNKLPVTGKIDLKTLNCLYSEDVKAYTITKNSSPTIIKVYQQKLLELGYYFGEVDGIYSEEFRSSVRMYQLNNSQYTDGLIGPSTKFSLDSKYAKPFSMYLGQRGENIKVVQKRLVELQYLEERMATGYYGEFTAQAIALFQKEVGLPLTGSVDGTTLVKLVADDAPISPTGPIKFIKQFVMDTLDIQKNIHNTEDMGTVDDLLKVAKLKLGSKYVWGSRGPNTFDCSGFVFWCLNQVGVNVTYMTTYNWRFSTQFEKVEKFEDLQVGDLVVLSGHMGIVCENETVIDASSSNGKVVHRDLDDFWKERFIVGFRIFQDNQESQEVKN